MKFRKEKMIKCERCGREIEKIRQRKYCIQCRRIRDYELKMESKKKAALKLKKQKNEILSNENN